MLCFLLFTMCLHCVSYLIDDDRISHCIGDGRVPMGAAASEKLLKNAQTEATLLSPSSNVIALELLKELQKKKKYSMSCVGLKRGLNIGWWLKEISLMVGLREWADTGPVKLNECEEVNPSPRRQLSWRPWKTRAPRVLGKKRKAGVWGTEWDREKPKGQHTYKANAFQVLVLLFFKLIYDSLQLDYPKIARVVDLYLIPDFIGTNSGCLSFQLAMRLQVESSSKCLGN